MKYFKQLALDGTVYGVFKQRKDGKLIGADKSCNIVELWGNPLKRGKYIEISRSTYYRYLGLLNGWRNGNHYVRLLNIKH